MLNPPLTGQQVGRLRRRGMPGDPGGAAAWRARNLDLRFIKVHRNVTTAGQRAPDVADLVAEAGIGMVASLVVELGISIEAANVAVSGIGLELSLAGERLGMPGAADAVFFAGPLSGYRPASEVAATRKAIEARIAEMRAEETAVD